MEKKRIEYLDAIKGFAILLVVMAHTIAWNYSDYNDICVYDPNQPINVKMGGGNLAVNILFPYAIVFYGFLSYKIYHWKDFFPFLKKKVTRLLIPWISTFGIIYIVRGSMGYWFLLCLFEISIISFLLIMIMEKVNTRQNLFFDIVLICSAFALLRIFHVQNWELYGIALGRIYTAFMPFMVGVLLRKYKSLYNLCVCRSWFYTVTLLLFIVLFVSRYLLNNGIIFLQIYHHSQMVLALSGSLVVFHAFAQNLLGRFYVIFSFLGRQTLPIYVLHIMFVLQIPAIGDFILSQNMVSSLVLQITCSILISTIAIALSLLFYKIFIISPLLKWLFFGENK